MFREVLRDFPKEFWDTWDNNYCVLTLSGGFWVENLGLFGVKIQQRDLLSVLKMGIFPLSKLPDKFRPKFFIYAPENFFLERLNTFLKLLSLHFATKRLIVSKF